MTTMTFSVWPRVRQPYADILAVVRHAESTGWTRAYLADHFMGAGDGGPAPDDSPTLEATAALAALAGATTRIGLGTLVLGMTYRHPAVVAKWATTLDQASDGRLVLGLGTGWQLNEHEAYGIRLGPPGERVARFVEGVEIIKGLLTQPRTTVIGTHYRVTDAPCEPKAVQQPLPLLIGAKGPRMLRVAARYADEWNAWSTPASFRRLSAELDRACEEIGRDPATIHRSTQALVDVADQVGPPSALGQPAIIGPVDRFAETVAEWAEAGVDEVIVPDWLMGTGARRADMLDALREAVAAP